MVAQHARLRLTGHSQTWLLLTIDLCTIISNYYSSTDVCDTQAYESWLVNASVLINVRMPAMSHFRAIWENILIVITLIFILISDTFGSGRVSVVSCQGWVRLKTDYKSCIVYIIIHQIISLNHYMSLKLKYKTNTHNV